MNRIKQLREEISLNQVELGKIINVSGQAIGMYENEKRGIDSKIAVKLAEYFNVSTDYLLGKSDVRNPEKVDMSKVDVAFDNGVMVFGERIKQLRIEKKWTQEFVCVKLNISSGALSRYETSMYEPKSLELVKDFANLFNVSTDYLLGKSDIRNIDVVNIDDADVAFYDGVKGLNETNKNILKGIIEGLVAKQKEEEKKENK